MERYPVMFQAMRGAFMFSNELFTSFNYFRRPREESSSRSEDAAAGCSFIRRWAAASFRSAREYFDAIAKSLTVFASN